HLHRRDQLRIAGGRSGGPPGAKLEGSMSRRWALIAAIAFLLAAAPWLTSEVFIQFGIGALLIATLAQSWNIIGAVAGYASFGNSVFVGLGTYGTAVAMAQWHQPFWLGLILGAVVAMLCALLLGLPILRLRGPYFAIATLGLSAAMAALVANLEFAGANV